MPVIDYLEFCAPLQKVPKAEVLERIREMVRVWLDVEKHKRIRELSKDTAKSRKLAQAMIHDRTSSSSTSPLPAWTPTRSWRSGNSSANWAKKTVILSTHILPEVDTTCDRILIINQGRSLPTAPPIPFAKQALGQQVLQVRIPRRRQTDEDI